jgi:hypothetical protein
MVKHFIHGTVGLDEAESDWSRKEEKKYDDSQSSEQDGR